jgi:hypothetical protein
MNTSQLRTALSGDPKVGPQFVGVFACDQLPRGRMEFPAALVANTDPASESGKHWVAFYFDSGGNAEYFDSYGIAPQNCDLFDFFKAHGKNHKFNGVQLQSGSSSVCGHWCIAFLKKRCHGQSMDEIVRGFETCCKKNNRDAVVGSLVNSAYNIKQIKTAFQDGGGKIKQQSCCSRTCARRRCINKKKIKKKSCK